MTDAELAELRTLADTPEDVDGESDIRLDKADVSRLIARLDAAERVCQWWSEHNQDCRDRQALYGSDSYCDCGYSDAMRDWRKAKGEAE